jgi:hypothetical protein
MYPDDLQALRDQRDRTAAGIADVETALSKERAKLARYDHQIEEAERVMGAHGLPPCKRGDEDHAWQIEARFGLGPNRGQWRHRKCRACGTEERLGDRTD